MKKTSRTREWIIVCWRSLNPLNQEAVGQDMGHEMENGACNYLPIVLYVYRGYGLSNYNPIGVVRYYKYL